MDEAGRIEQYVTNKKKTMIPKKIFLIGFERLNELLSWYPNLKDFCWA